MDKLFLSIVIPVKDELDNVKPLTVKLNQVLRDLKQTQPAFSYEVLFSDDGSTDGTREVLREVVAQFPECQAVFFRKNFGKSAALAEGFRRARGEIIITMDGDLQDEPAEIPQVLNKLNEGFDLVSTWKYVRHDPLEKRVMSKIFNFIVSRISGVPLHDFNCGFKAYRAWCAKGVALSGNLYRFLPVLVAKQGGKIAELKVAHHQRRSGQSKYHLRRYFHGVLDLFTVILITRFFSNPIYFFAVIGLPLLGLGAGIGAYLCGCHIYSIVSGDISYALWQSRPLLTISLGLFGFGLNILLVGALAEFFLSLRGAPGAGDLYTVETVISKDEFDKRLDGN